MASIKFYLRPRKNDGPLTMFFLASVNGKRLKVYLDRKVLKNDFDVKKQSFVIGKESSLDLKGKQELNRWLADIEKNVMGFLIDCERDEISPTVDMVKAYVKGDVKKPKEQNVDIWKMFEIFIEEPVRSRGVVKKRENSSIRSIRGLKKHLEGYQKNRKVTLGKASFNDKFIKDFASYLTEEGEGKGNLQDSTANKTLKDLKAFLRFCKDQDYIRLPLPKIIVERHETGSFFYLTEEEIERIENLDLENGSLLSKARDIFLAQLYSGGQRVSDIRRLKPSWIKNGRLVFFQKKTQKELDIPISQGLWEILERNNLSLPKITEQEINRSLKEIGEMAMLFDSVRTYETRGGIKTEVDKPKYEILSSHDARRSFIMLALDRGMNITDVMVYSGHKDIKSLMIYVDHINSKKSDERFLAALNKGKEVSVE